MKRRIIPFLLAFASVLSFFSCNKGETYADQKKRERQYIDNFISRRGITVIEEATFKAQGNRTNGNQYVYMNNTGVYMNITRIGAGTPLQNQENTSLYIRFTEINLGDTTKYMSNMYSPYDPDIMSIKREGTTFTASFTYGGMLASYGASVPAGWLVPLNYINVGGATATEDVSLVKLIVPHSQGHTVSSGNVCPYYYEISFQRSPGL
jgi:hypothetical protein